MGLSVEFAILAQVVYHYGLFVLKKLKKPELKYNPEYRKVTLISIGVTIFIYCFGHWINSPFLVYISDPMAAAGFGLNCLKGTHFFIDYFGPED